MWMMIAGHAGEWLISHGHEADAKAVLRMETKQGARQGKANSMGAR